VERQPGSLGMSRLTDPEVGAVRFESFWVSGRALVESEDVTAVARRAAAHRAGGAATAERYEVLVFEREAPLRSGGGEARRSVPSRRPGVTLPLARVSEAYWRVCEDRI